MKKSEKKFLQILWKSYFGNPFSQAFQNFLWPSTSALKFLDIKKHHAGRAHSPFFATRVV